jgi:hypothetical protein
MRIAIPCRRGDAIEFGPEVVERRIAILRQKAIAKFAFVELDRWHALSRIRDVRHAISLLHGYPKCAVGWVRSRRAAEIARATLAA